MSPSRGWLFLCLVARVSAICSEAPDAGQVRVKAVNTDCPAIYAPAWSPPEETCLRGRNPGSMLSGRFEQITVRAVSYDVYTSALRHIHQRDLYLIAKVLKANAVKLEPWDDEADHSEFLRLCREYGLFVIPTFDLKYFFQDKWLKRSNSLEREKELPLLFCMRGLGEMLKHWDELLRSVYNTDPILAWTVNYALLLNETISQIPKDRNMRVLFLLPSALPSSPSSCFRSAATLRGDLGASDLVNLRGDLLDFIAVLSFSDLGAYVI
eukprot:s5186_g5.t1